MAAEIAVAVSDVVDSLEAALALVLSAVDEHKISAPKIKIRPVWWFDEEIDEGEPTLRYEALVSGSIEGAV